MRTVLLSALLSLSFPLGAVPAVDDIVIIEEDEDDGLIIIDDGDPEEGASEPKVTGALSSLWETFYVEADGQLGSVYQPGARTPLRTRVDLELSGRLLPARNLKLSGGAIARGIFDVGDAGGELDGFADLYEAFATINAEIFALKLGRVVVPWGRTQVAALGDRVNPPDHRRGPSFARAGRVVQPQLGAVLGTSLGGLGVEAIALVLHEPTEGSLVASEQGGVRSARYQGAILRDARVFGRLDRATGLGARAFWDDVSAGVRVSRQLGDLDVGASVLYAPDATPTLRLNPDFARNVARELIAPTSDELCAGVPSSCALRPGDLVHEATTSFTGDATWGLGVVIVKVEALAMPRAGALRGKTTLLLDDERGVFSTPLAHGAAALALESGLGNGLSGSLEIFDLVWFGVPDDANLLGIESPEARGPRPLGLAHRLALGASLGGTFQEETIVWRVHGEAGLNQLDVLMNASVRYRLPFGDFYVGAYTDVFAGLEGTPGWMRAPATRVGVMLGEGR